MRAVLVDEVGAPPRLVDVPEPNAEPGRTIVRVRAAVVSHLDVQVTRGEVPLPARFPLVPGTEAAGEVVASSTFPIGAPVRVRGGGVGVGAPGCWAELVSAPDRAVTELASAGSWGLAAAAFSPAATAWAAVHDVAALQAGERVLVTGAAGAVGSVAVQLASAHGCTVVGQVGDGRRGHLVPDGATTVIATGDWDSAVAEGNVGNLDAVIDTVGGDPLVAGIRALRPGGRVALVGYTAGDQLAMPLSELIVRDISLLPTNLLRRGPGLVDRGAELLGDLVAGKLSLAVHEYPLDDHDRAIGALFDRDVVGRVVVVP